MSSSRYFPRPGHQHNSSHQSQQSILSPTAWRHQKNNSHEVQQFDLSLSIPSSRHSFEDEERRLESASTMAEKEPFQLKMNAECPCPCVVLVPWTIPLRHDDETARNSLQYHDLHGSTNPTSLPHDMLSQSEQIARFFKITNPSLIPWMIAAYALTFGTFILIAGRLGDIFGHKRMVVTGFCFMAFWSAVAGVSNYAGYELFFVARAMQGIGSAMMNPNGLALLGRTYAPGSKEKIFAFSLFGLCAPLGAYGGMITGAAFSEYVQWYWAFYTLAIVSIILAGLAQLVFVAPPPTPKQMQSFGDKFRDMDWLGAFTGVAGLVCIQVAWVCAPSVGWGTQFVFMLLIMGILLVVAFGLVETRLAAQPLVPFKLFKGDVGFVLAAVGCGWATFGIWSWYLWRFLLFVRSDTPMNAAIQVVPIVPVALVASVLTAYLMRTTKPAWILFWALVAFALGPTFLVFARAHQSYWSFTLISLLVMPFGMDMSFPAATIMMSNAVPQDKQGIAGSLVSTVVNYSISLGLGFAATVEANVNEHGKNPLKGIRGGWFTGIGVGVFGVVITIIFLLKGIVDARRSTPIDQQQQRLPKTTAKLTPKSSTTDRFRSYTVSSQATLTPSKEKKSGSFSSDKEPLPNGISFISPFSPPLPPMLLQEKNNNIESNSENLVTPRTFDENEGLGLHMPTEMEPAHKRTGSWESFDIEEHYNYTKEEPRKKSRVPVRPK